MRIIVRLLLCLIANMAVESVLDPKYFAQAFGLKSINLCGAQLCAAKQYEQSTKRREVTHAEKMSSFFFNPRLASFQTRFKASKSPCSILNSWNRLRQSRFQGMFIARLLSMCWPTERWDLSNQRLSPNQAPTWNGMQIALARSVPPPPRCVAASARSWQTVCTPPLFDGNNCFYWAERHSSRLAMSCEHVSFMEGPLSHECPTVAGRG